MIIKNITLCDASGSRVCDVELDGGVIVKIADDLAGSNTLDGSGKFLIPRLVDLNISPLDGVLNAKNILSLCDEAKSGGVGHLLINATTSPMIDNEVVLEFAQNATSSSDEVRVDLMFNTLREDLTLSNNAILTKRGAKPFMSTVTKNDQAIRIAQYSQMHKNTLFCKAEDNSLISSGVMLEGDVSTRLGLAGIPELSEVLHVSRMIEIAREFEISLVFKSIASPRSIELITKAKKEGVKVACEVSLHHLLHSDEACLGFDTTAKLNPPLASKQSVLKLQEALKQKEIDLLTTLHQPSSPINKETSFNEASYGCESLSFAMSLYYTMLVKSGILSLSDLLKLTVDAPLRSLGEEPKPLMEGSKNLMIFDPSFEFSIDDNRSLYCGKKLFGEVRFI